MVNFITIKKSEECYQDKYMSTGESFSTSHSRPAPFTPPPPKKSLVKNINVKI